ncbi:L-allo-threonine aldolase [compost metagenome]
MERLAEDHENARQLAEGLRGIAGVKVLSQDTNMVFAEFEPSRCDALTAALAKEGILMRAVYGGPTRLVTHLDVSAADVRRVVDTVGRLLA